jgi:hypothetical protein
MSDNEEVHPEVDAPDLQSLLAHSSDSEPADGPTEINFADDLGGDPTGDALSDNALAAINGLSGPTVITVPIGEYRLSATSHRIDGPEHLALRADTTPVTPESPVDSTLGRPRFIAPAEYPTRWLDITGRTIRIDGLTIDRHAFGAGPQLRLRARDRLDVSRLTLAGRDGSDRGASDGTMIDVAVADRGEARINGLSIEHGSRWSKDSLNRAASDQSATIGRSGLRIGPRNQGDVTVTNAQIEECAGHGLDAFESGGAVTVDGGRFANNNGAQIRSTHPDDLIADTTVRVDLDTVDTPDRSGREIIKGLSPDAYTSVSGVVFDRSDGPEAALSSGTLRDSDVRIASVAGEVVEIFPVGGDESAFVWIAGPAVAVRRAAGGPTVERSDLIVDLGEIEALAASYPSRDEPTDDEAANRVVVRGTTMGGEARAGTALIVRGRDVRFRGGCIERPGDRRPDDLPSGTVLKRVNFEQRCPRRT